MNLRRFLAGSVAVLFLLAPSSSAAATVSELMATIAALQAQLAALQGGSTSSSGTSCVALTRNLYFGLNDASTGGEVSKLQKYLGGQVTGYFGPATELLVQAWQKKNSIVSSGTADTTGYGAVGPTTRAKINASCTGSISGQSGSSTSGTKVTKIATTSEGDASCSIKSSKKEVAPGETFTLKWTTKSIVLPVMVQNVKGGGEQNIAAKGSMNWTAESASDGKPFYDEFLIRDGAASSYFPLCTVPVRIVPEGYEPTATFKASPASIDEGDSTTLSWTSKNANRCSIWDDGNPTRSVGTSGSLNVTPAQTTTYTLSCTNDPGTGKDGPTVIKTATVTIEEANDWGTGVAVVGVYEGSYATPRGFQQHPEGTVNVRVTGGSDKSRDIVLTSYEPVNWILDVPGGTKIDKIIVTGYYKSRVTNVPSGTRVEYHSYDTDGQYYYAYQSSGDAYARLKSWVTGLYPASDGELYGNFIFPGYSASSVEVYVGYKG